MNSQKYFTRSILWLLALLVILGGFAVAAVSIPGATTGVIIAGFPFSVGLIGSLSRFTRTLVMGA